MGLKLGLLLFGCFSVTATAEFERQIEHETAPISARFFSSKVCVGFSPENGRDGAWKGLGSWKDMIGKKETSSQCE